MYRYLDMDLHSQMDFRQPGYNDSNATIRFELAGFNIKHSQQCSDSGKELFNHLQYEAYTTEQYLMN